MKRSFRLLLALGVFGLVPVGCAITYNEADLREEGRKEAADARAEAEEYRATQEAGGENAAAIDEEAERAERERDM